MFWEVGSSGRDYADFFRDEALRLGLVSEVVPAPELAGRASRD
jgi:enoyl-CoA hydratase/carnithine racemase